MSAAWQQQADEWTFEIRADAFLYRMVRRLVYAQVAVGQARLSAETLLQALDDRSEAGQVGPQPDPCQSCPGKWPDTGGSALR